ncbi:HK97 family phage prohead protease [Sporosarcina sp. Sa2YVA2]|uniref:HK97 family phage prohead protease n=1 Tax=Sporosarcina quadrami TaxID=2762234 RepID=A0ABR8UBA7_9BACL|nr:HK97 family phage prohead protease [Sporosarcina quadrami]
MIWGELSSEITSSDGEKFRERFSKGSLVESITKRNQELWYNHKKFTFHAGVDEGSLQFEEDDVGLWMEAKLVYTDRTKEAFMELATWDSKAVSIGFLAKDCTYQREKSETIRNVKKAELVEVSLVNKGAYPSAFVTVKGYMEERGYNRREWEQKRAKRRLLQLIDS